MPANYNSSEVGVPYIRANNIAIQYPPNGVPTVFVSQALAVKLADGSVAELGSTTSFSFTPDMVGNSTTPIPLVDPTTGAELGANTNLQSIMLGILAVIRQHQVVENP